MVRMRIRPPAARRTAIRAVVGSFSTTSEHCFPGEKKGLDVDGVSMLICSAGGTLYAYRNACAACGSSMEEGVLQNGVITCPSCERSYDVRVAGRSSDQSDLHLHPFPLLPEAGAWKVALGSAAY